MTPLAVNVGLGVLALLGLFALRGKRWAYLAFVLLGLLYVPAQAQFRVHAPRCDLLLPTMQVVMLSLESYARIALFAGFYWMSWVQFRRADGRLLWALLATLLAGALVEITEGMTGRLRGPALCRVQDLVPAAAGALGAALLLAIWARLTRKPGYVRIVKKHSPAAPRVSAPTRAAPPPPPRASAPSRWAVPPPADFSPGPPVIADGTAPEEAAETEEVAAPRQVSASRVASRVVAVLRQIGQRLLAMLYGVWSIIRRRRRAIVIGIGLVALVGGAAFWVMTLEPPAPVVTEAPKPPPPPPRPLQSDAEGYYEPGYQFVVADRRFTRLTLRPDPFVTFSRVGTRTEAGCADARIGADAVFLRCELDRVGMVTIDGRFPSRYATSRLDAQVLTAMITVTNLRGEVLYRARDHFRWHAADEAP
jgi:hypothetical protein